MKTTSLNLLENLKENKKPAPSSPDCVSQSFLSEIQQSHPEHLSLLL